MSNIFNNIDLTSLQTDKRITDTNQYQQISNLSDFPVEIDSIKEIIFNSNSSDEISYNFNKYYELINEYLSTPSSFNKMDELKSTISYIKDYVLSSEDYSILRDALLELSNYLNEITHKQIYNSETGIYTELTKISQNFNQQLNDIINEINSKYSNLPNDTLGKIIPEGAVNKNYLSDELKENFNYINLTEGIYVDRSDDGTIQIPNELQEKPIVIKVGEI